METTNATMTQDVMKSMLLGFADLLNEQRGKLPTGCVSDAGNGVYNAHSITNLNGLQYNVDAPDGFIRDGLMVRFLSQRKSGLTDKFRGYKVMFELTGIYNGTFTVFTKTEMEYKRYLNNDMWKIESKEVVYKPIAADGSEFKRIYKIPMVIDTNTGEFRCVDNKNTLNNKVGLAMSSKLGADYNAYIDGLVYNEADKKFIAEEQEAI